MFHKVYLQILYWDVGYMGLFTKVFTHWTVLSTRDAQSLETANHKCKSCTMLGVRQSPTSIIGSLLLYLEWHWEDEIGAKVESC